jgi:hypothetical protein
MTDHTEKIGSEPLHDHRSIHPLAQRQATTHICTTGNKEAQQEDFTVLLLTERSKDNSDTSNGSEDSGDEVLHWRGLCVESGLCFFPVRQ